MTYEYLCTACHYEWEAEQPISAKPLEECPNCRQKTAKRQVSGGAGFILKGGGWYSDGYASKSASGTSEPKAEGSEKGSKPAKESSEGVAPKPPASSEGTKGPTSAAAAA